MKLEVDLDAFVANDKPRFDLEGNYIRLQPGEVRVRGRDVIDDYGWSVARDLPTKEDAYFVARCLHALKGVVPVPGTEEGRAIYEQQVAQAKVLRAERELAKAKGALK